jgi:hypothetical protein
MVLPVSHNNRSKLNRCCLTPVYFLLISFIFLPLPILMSYSALAEVDSLKSDLTYEETNLLTNLLGIKKSQPFFFSLEWNSNGSLNSYFEIFSFQPIPFLQTTITLRC